MIIMITMMLMLNLLIICEDCITLNGIVVMIEIYDVNIMWAMLEKLMNYKTVP